MLDQINAKIVDGANEYSTLTHASYIGPKWWVEMTEAMVQPFTERFTNEYNREPGPSGIAIIESSVGKQTLLPETQLFVRGSTLSYTSSAIFHTSEIPPHLP